MLLAVVRGRRRKMDSELRAKEETSNRGLLKTTGKIQTFIQERQRRPS